MAPAVEPLLVDPPGPGEVRVRLAASSICHTDLLMVEGRAWWPDHPYVLGHEGAGYVESVGPGVDPRRIGELVLLAWKAPCGRCRFCAAGRTRMCVDPLRAPGRLRTHDGRVATPALRVGSHASLTVVPSAAAIPLPPAIEPELACLLGCAVLTGVGAARETAAVAPGQRVAVFGCGGVGLSTVQGARLAGAATIIAIDPVASKLEVARQLGATHVVRGGLPGTVEAVRAAAGGYGVDHAFDAVGRGSIIVDALRCLDAGGTCTLVGTPDVGDVAAVPLELLYLKRLGLRVSQYGDALPDRDGPMLAELYLRGELDLRALLTGTITLDEAPAGLGMLRSGAVIRTVIRLDHGLAGRAPDEPR